MKPTMRAFLRPSPPWLALIATLAFTAAAALLAERSLQARQQVLFSTAVQTQLGRLQSRLDAYTALLRATRAYVQASGAGLDRQRFADYVERLRIAADYPGIQGVGWSPRVEPGRIAQFEAAARREGMADFRVWPVGTREWMFSILYLQPLDERNQAALGFDMYSEPVRAAAMARARDSGVLATSGRVTLKQEISTDKQAGFLIYVPLYGSGEPPATLAERRARLTGFVYAPFRATDFFGGLFEPDNGLVAVRVHAGAAPGRLELLHDGFPGNGPPPQAPGIEQRRIEVGGQPWTLEFHALPGLVTGTSAALVPAIVATGSLVGLLLFAMTRSRRIKRMKIERLSAERAAALDAERAQRELAESLTALAHSVGREPDIDAVIRQVVETAARLTGADYGAFLRKEGGDGAQPHEHRTSDTRPAMLQALARLRDTPLLAAAFSGRTVRIDDLPRSGEHGDPGQYAALESASFLAACVCTRERRVLGALFFGHHARGRFSPTHAALVESIASQAALVLETAALRRRERETHSRIQEENALLEIFVGIASHDLRNPLNVILLSTALMERGAALPEPLEPALGRIRRNAERCMRLVRDLLDFTQARLGRGIPIAPATVDLAALAARLVDEFRLAHPERDFGLSAEPGLLGLFDEDRIAQMMSNLLTNAVAYGAPATPVRLALHGEGDTLVLTVANHGEPIPAALQEAVFEPLRQGGAGKRENAARNIGLGLFIVDQIARAHGGSVSLRSDAEATVFTVRLPREGAATVAAVRQG